jgi:hypothetical protein
MSGAAQKSRVIAADSACSDDSNVHRRKFILFLRSVKQSREFAVSFLGELVGWYESH